MKTVVLANQKGGVGKSAIATLLAHYLADKGQRVLAVDFDHQGNLARPLKLSGRVTLADFGASQLMTRAGARAPEGRFVVVSNDDALRGLERQASLHNDFASHCRTFLRDHDSQFDVCIIDTNPNPDIRLLSALISADHVLSPIQLNQEAIEGIADLLTHPRYGIRKIKAVLNPKLNLIGLLPTLVEHTPFQRGNLAKLLECHMPLMIPLSERPGHAAFIPKRSAIAEAQSDGTVLWAMKKTAARDTWAEIEPSIARIAALVLGEHSDHAV